MHHSFQTAPPVRPRTAASQPGTSSVREELLLGLAQPQARIAPKFLYDRLGSRLFEAITELPEYYPTRTEARLLAQHAAQIAQALPQAMTLVDLGAGNCRKAAGLLPVLRPAQYVAVDISAAFLAESLQALQARHPRLPMRGLGLDFSQALDLDAEGVPGPRVLFYPGSSIGNFEPAEALRFLQRARAQCDGGGLLIGVDLHKPAEVLLPAYDDALRVTAAFNRNVLRHVNRLLGSDFELADWRHFAFFNEEASCIEMQLQALRSAPVHWPGGGRRFAAGERILTERSYKWRWPDFESLLGRAGFTPERRWVDERGWFALCWASA